LTVAQLLECGKVDLVGIVEWRRQGGRVARQSQDLLAGGGHDKSRSDSHLHPVASPRGDCETVCAAGADLDAKAPAVPASIQACGRRCAWAHRWRSPGPPPGRENASANPAWSPAT